MSSVLNFYMDRLEPIEIEGKEDEKVLIVRRGRTVSPRAINNYKKLLAFLNTKIRQGDIITRKDGIKYFITAYQYSSACVECQAQRINSKCSIYTIKHEYEEMELTSKREVVAENILASQQDISAKMKTYDAGLLNQTIKSILIKADYNVKVADIVNIDDIDYMILNVDKSKFDGLLYLQLGEETRKVE